MYYFGPWVDWQGALRRYHASLEAPPDALKTVIARYMETRDKLRQSGEISDRHYRDTDRTLASLSETIGPSKPVAALTSADYRKWRAKLSETNGPVALTGYIVRVRTFLNWCKREKIIAEMPADGLQKPSRKVLRLERAKRGSKMFSREEIRSLLRASGDSQFHAMLLLALNAGLGPEDLARLTTAHIKGMWLDYPRPKTGIERRVPLWPETQQALAKIIRPDDTAVFRTKYGNLWTVKGDSSPISHKFTKLCQNLGIHKPRRGFYSLRHVCQTVGEEAGDHPAIEYILGHSPPADDMASVYRERMKGKRLVKVVKHIRRWVFGKKAKVETLPKVEKATVETTAQGVA